MDGKTKSSSRYRSSIECNTDLVNYENFVDYRMNIQEPNENHYRHIDEKNSLNNYSKYANASKNKSKSNEIGSLEIDINSASMSPDRNLNNKNRNVTKKEV